MAGRLGGDHAIAELLAAPVRAIQEAQIAAEREFVEFFLEYALEEVEQTPRGREPAFRVRNLQFDMKRSVPDTTNPGTVVERTATVTAPLMSLINFPSVVIEEATINLALDVSAETSAEAEGRQAAPPAAAMMKRLNLPSGKRAALELRGYVGAKATGRSLRTKGRLEVTMKLASSRQQDSLDRLASLLDESLSSHLAERE